MKKKIFITAVIASCIQPSYAGELSITNNEPASQLARPFLDCKKRTGALLCNKIENLINLFDYECRGNHCYELFSRQGLELDGLTYAINYFLKDDTEVSLDLFEKARLLSKEICRSQISGESLAITKLTLSMNSALRGLKQLQNKLSVPPGSSTDDTPYTCRMMAD